jgi:signal transduction histidine kinase
MIFTKSHPAPMLLVLAFRWLTVAWMAALAVVSGQVQRPLLAAVAVAGTLAWTAWLTMSMPRRTTAVLAVDLAVAAGLLIVSGHLHPAQQVLTNHSWFAGAYPMAAVAAWGVVHGVRGGLGAGCLLGLALPVAYTVNGAPPADLSYLQALHLVAAALAYPLLGLAVGTATLQFGRLSRHLAEHRGRAARAAERERLVARIHDDVLQHLAQIRRRGTDLVERPSVAARDVRALMADLERQETALRTLARPEPVLPTGTRLLDDALEEVLAGVALPTSLVSSGAVTLPVGTATEVLAAVREAVDNVVKHAGATRLWVVVLRDADGVTVSVHDDGTGFVFDEAAFAAAGRLGLRVSVRARVERLGGRVELRSRLGKGTEVELWLPAGLLDAPPGPR